MSKKNKEQHPTLFVLEGSILYHKDGSMLDLHTRITDEEWQQIVEETIKYKVFVECLKEIGMPLLSEQWEEKDDYYRIQLDIAVSRMRNIDPLLVASHKQDSLKEEYIIQMKTGAVEMRDLIDKVREETEKAELENADDDEDVTSVSNL